ncbi:MAG: 50S ribosomal protein L11 methyltransferase [Lentisphaeria bacterium]|nr:50S ribosomal protein L11 methyltransferase [Lentisphaeria bacterium]
MPSARESAPVSAMSSDVPESLSCVEWRMAEADIPVAEELLGALGWVPASWIDRVTATAVVRVYAASQAEAGFVLRSILEAMPDWRTLFGSEPPAPTLTTTLRENWAESWKRHFHTFRASRRTVVKPSWERYEPEPGDVVIRIDPGMCFGTGQHATTRACLAFLDDLALQLGPVSFLDAGCGSGILSVAAAQLGFRPITAFDHDPQAVEMTRRNLRQAGVEGAEVVCADIAEFRPGRTFRVVAANILAPILERNRAGLLGWLDTSGGPGWLLLSGILTEQYPAVREAFVGLGAGEVESLVLDEWTSGCFAFDGHRARPPGPPCGRPLASGLQGSLLPAPGSARCTGAAP